MKKIFYIILGLFIPQSAFANQPVEWQLGFQKAASESMRDIVAFHDNLLLPIIIAISVFVLFLMLYACVRFRASANPNPSKRTHNVTVEVLWTLIPCLILIVMAVPSFKILYKQKITRNIIFALLIGWIGILVILNPSQLSNINVEIENASISIAFLGAICTALAYVTVKKLSFTEDVYVIIEYFPLVSFIALLPIVLMNWVTPTWNELVWIIGIGLFTQLGQTFLTIGLKNLPASEASTINYLQVLFGSIWGILFFSEIININFLLGASLVLLGTIISTTKIIKRT